MTYTIISGQYEFGTEDQQSDFKMLLGEDNIQHKFDLYFHWYNIVHELGHCVVDSQQIHMSGVQEEMFVNEFAVAYWNYIGAEARLNELEDMLNGIHTSIPSPVPHDMSLAEYYESIWETEILDNVMVYGYFQLNSVLEALKAKKDFKTVLNSIGIDLNRDIVMSKYEDAICAENAHKVFDQAVANIRKLDIRPIQVVLELVENPTIQCAQTCE